MQPVMASPTTLELISLVEDGVVDQALGILDSTATLYEADFIKPWGSLQVTLVQLAAWAGSLPILERLKSRGADLDAIDKIGRCALHHAVHEGHVHVVKWLLEHGATVETSFGVTFLPKNQPYTVSRTSSNYEIGKKLPLPDCWGRTALHQAVKAGHIDIVQLLVDAGANVDARDERGITPLHLAAVDVNIDDPKEMSRFEKVVDILVTASAPVNVVHPDTGTTALHHAVTLGSRKATQRLLEGGAYPAARCTSTGITPLHIAASAGFHDTLNILLEHLDSSLINVQDEIHLTLESLMKGKAYLWRYDCEAKYNFTGPGDKTTIFYPHTLAIGRTPLHAAAYRGHLKCIRALVDHGGSLAAKTETGVTVIDAIFDQVARPVAFLTDILDARIRATDKTVNTISLDFRVLAPRGELQMAVVSALIGAVPFMEQMTILQHPLVEAFLGLKWSRLRRFFFILVLVHVFFVLSLSGYALALLNNKDLPVLRRLLLFCACILLCNNLLQLLIAPRVYARQFETWLSMICATVSVVVAVVGEQGMYSAEGQSPNPSSWVMQSISIAILFAWIQMMLIVGRFPTWGHYALMFSTVLKNVSKVLLAFVWLIIGFALSFSVLFHGNNQFSSSWKSFVKTVVMIMGEYDYDGLFASIDNRNDSSNLDGNQKNEMKSLNASENSHHDLLPLTSRIIFLIFVMLASIVLMNLLIGLAVSDIQGLLNEGHIRRLMKQAAFVAHLEWVRSHRMLQGRFMQRCLKSRNSVPTGITLGMYTGYGQGTHGISEELVEVLFGLAAKNRAPDKKFQSDATCEKKRVSLADTISFLQEEVRDLKQDRGRTPRMQSTRIKIGKRRKSHAT